MSFGNKKCFKENKWEIGRIIEPSAGSGVFSSKIRGCIAYDIEPEGNNIIKADFLKERIPYTKNTLVIGNPPFGSRLNLAKKFFLKATEISDYIAFILPISQLNNTNFLYQFDLVHSEDLGVQTYTDRKLHCCFNIYKRPKKGLNKKRSQKLKCVEIVRQDSKKYLDFKEDIRMCYWGNGSAGKILEPYEEYSAVYKIKFSKPFKKEGIEVLKTINWKEELNCIAMLKIQQHHIISVLKKYIKEIY